MYAVVRFSGKQHRVSKDQVLKVDRLEAEVGQVITWPEVLMLAGGEAEPVVGSPMVDGASVKVEVLAHPRGNKIKVFKKRRRKGFSKLRGHRQDLTEVRVVEING